ncbi:MAG: PspC domain-containing protein, partial [Chloroflexota bacterium]|nr:PspC domain-containing protein [Chloroflexota bacterium]
APPPPQPPPAYPPVTPLPPRPRRLTRSSRERMWAGVAGGMAEYFDLDPALVRLLWVAAAVVSGGLAIPVYIVASIILPRDDRPPASGIQWRDWSHEFQTETQRLAEEARRIASGTREPQPSAPDSAAHEPSAHTAEPEATPYTPPAPAAWPAAGPDVEPQRNHGARPRSAGVVLVGLGVLLLAANAGMFSWIEWRYMWPLIFIGLGLALLARQSDWGNR